MKPASLLLGLFLAATTASLSQAQITIDMAKITCKQLPSLKVNRDYIAIWLSGYYNAKRDNVAVDIDRFKEFAKRVRNECIYGNGGTVMEAVEKLMGSEKPAP